MEETQNFKGPDAPAFLPAELKKKWETAYAQGYERAQQDYPEDPSGRQQSALREANQLLRVPKITSYEQAKALPDWQVIKREEVGGELKVVTIDGRKFRFPVPPKRAKEPEQAAGGPGNSGAGNGAANGQKDSGNGKGKQEGKGQGKD